MKKTKAGPESPAATSKAAATSGDVAGSMAGAAKRQTPLRRFADAMAKRIATPDESPEAWADIREAIADHLDAYLRREVAEVDREIAVLLASSLRQVLAKEPPTLWTPPARRQGESPDPAGASACIATAVEYIAYNRAYAAEPWADRQAVKTVAAAFAVAPKTVYRWVARASSAGALESPSGPGTAQRAELLRLGVDVAARHYPKFGGSSSEAQRVRGGTKRGAVTPGGITGHKTD